MHPRSSPESFATTSGFDRKYKDKYTTYPKVLDRRYKALYAVLAMIIAIVAAIAPIYYNRSNEAEMIRIESSLSDKQLQLERSMYQDTEKSKMELLEMTEQLMHLKIYVDSLYKYLPSKPSINTKK